MSGPDAPTEEPLGARTSELLHAIAQSAFDFNRAHRRLGSYLVEADPRGVTVGLDWHDDRFGPEGPAQWPAGILAALLDHSCALSVVMAVGSPERVSGTVDLRIDYLWPGRDGQGLHARAEWLHVGDQVSTSRAAVYHPGSADAPLAVATSTMAMPPRRPA